ncbi:hypothetical protein B0H14DRAFT_194377 [Mycena olivaceomarginata]|nr:hypothetical protein B0H14DRAFT_194377 [Mycena olivaceomarginata]
MYPCLCGTQFEPWIIGLSAILPVASNSCIWVWIQYNLTSRTYINIWALGIIGLVFRVCLAFRWNEVGTISTTTAGMLADPRSGFYGDISSCGLS